MSTAQTRYEINGYVDTNNNVLDNLETLGGACNTWITFDHNLGRWSIVINRAGSSVYSFNDDNIVGGIDVNETDFKEMYNSVEINFPHEDLLDQRDWVRIDIPIADRLPNEPLNRLTIKTDLTNDPVQAEQIALTELKQSRVNKFVEFFSDYSTLILKAGDIIDITNSNYSWNNKLFRIISVSEEDNESGNILIKYTCLEYDPSVYDYSDLNRFNRSRAQLTPNTINSAQNTSNDVATGLDLGRLLAITGLTSLFDLESVFNNLTGERTVDLKPGTCLGQSFISLSGSSSVCNQSPITVNYSVTPKSLAGCPVPITETYTVTNYAISGVLASDINIPLTGSFSGGSLTFTPNSSASGKTATVTFKNSSGNTLATRNVIIRAGFTVGVSKVDNGSTLTFNITSNAPSGTQLSWSISGNNLSEIYTGATSGTVTTDSNGNASQNISITTNTSTTTATLNFTISGGDCSSATASHSEAGTPDPDPPDPDPGPVLTEACQITSIPYVYCPVFDENGVLKSLNVKATLFVYQAPVGGVAVPTGLSVDGSGNIVSNGTINVEPASIGAPGFDVDVLTSGWTTLGPSDPTITGTATTIKAIKIT